MGKDSSLAKAIYRGYFDTNGLMTSLGTLVVNDLEFSGYF